MASIALLSNVTVGFLEQELKKSYKVYVPAGYDTWLMELYNAESILNSQKHDAEFYLFYGDALTEKWNSLQQGLEEMKKIGTMLSSHAKKNKSTYIFVSTLDFNNKKITDEYTISIEREWSISWYQILREITENHKNIYIYDWNETIGDTGRERFYSEKMWYTGSMPFSILGLKKVVNDIEYRMNGIYKNRKKCIALDLDNTLWGGVAGEDGPEHIVLSDHNQGKLFQDFQKRIKEIKELGIILVLLSKNNFDDVEQIISNHPHMILHWDDFAGYRINWDDKAKNLRELALELNIGMESIVFIDDNPAEREAMKHFCPEVVVPDFPKDASKLPKWAEMVYQNYFFTLQVTEEDKRKTQMYQDEKKRSEIKETVGSIEEYIDALQIEILIHRLKKGEIDRVSQLCMKTNQFNLTTKRYSNQQIAEMYLDDTYDIFTIHTKDKYGDNGLVSVVICKKENRSVEIDTFLMSCRVMGRYIENAIINKLIYYYKEKFDHLVGIYLETEKNKPVADLYTKLGFREEEKGRFVYALTQRKEWEQLIKTIYFDGEKE